MPLDTARRSAEVIDVAAVAVEKGNINSVTDAGVGAHIAFTGVQGGVFNVRINLKEIDDEKYIEEMKSTCRELESVRRAPEGRPPGSEGSKERVEWSMSSLRRACRRAGVTPALSLRTGASTAGETTSSASLGPPPASSVSRIASIPSRAAPLRCPCRVAFHGRT